MTSDLNPKGQRTGLTPYLLLCLTNLFWSFNFIIGKVVSDVVPPATISFFRWLLPALLFLSYNWQSIKDNRVLIGRSIPLLLALGCTGYAFNSICVYESVKYTTTINAAFINAFNPVLIAFAGYLMYSYPLKRIQGLGFFLSLVGVVFIIFKGQLRSILMLQVNIGDVFMLGSIISWALHTVLYKKKATRLPHNVIFTMMMCSGVIIALPIAIVENTFTGLDWLHQVGPLHILGIVALNIFPSVLAYIFWNRALRTISANEVAISQYLIPLFTTLISITFLGEKLHSFHFIGGGLVFLGVFLVTTSGWRRRFQFS